MSTIAAMVSRIYPSVEALSVAPLAGGNIHGVFEITCAKPPTKLVLKIYADEYQWKMEKEAYVYGLLAGRPGVTAPTVLVTDASKTLWQQNYAIMTKLDGIMLREAADSMSSDQLCSVYREMGLMLKQVHQIRFDAFGYIGTRVIEPKMSNADYMQCQFDKRLDEFERLGADPVIQQTIKSYVDANTFLLGSCLSPSLCHNDFHDANVMVSRETGRLVGILDVENAVAGDPLLDIAKTAIYPSQGNGPKLECLLEGYGGLPPGGDARIQIYQLYHSLELWDWMMARDPSTPWLPAIAEDIWRLARSGE
ncbi:MAG TPA: phosphotransferase [Blastocatellia bacterium]|nr:phosphotransferase [Blastocatellia bacterium]